MDNFAIADSFSLLAKLMDIHGENSFKTKTYSIAAYNIENLPTPLKDTPIENLPRLKGMGESVVKKVIELLETGKLSLLDNYLQNTPPGVLEMLQIKGLGPKKIHAIWKEMEIESVGELFYACNENRLTLYKGFGAKTQQNIQEAIEFFLQHQGSFLYAQIDEVFPQIDAYLKKTFSPLPVYVTGAYKRQDLTIEELEFIIGEENEIIKPKFQTAQPPELLEETPESLLYQLKNGLRLRLYTGKEKLIEKLFATTGSDLFLQTFQEQFPSWRAEQSFTDEKDIFSSVGLSYIPPFLREEATTITIAKDKITFSPISTGEIKGIVHSHSNWSDGVNTIEEMVQECIKRGLEYLVLSDHSKTAVYARGLNEQRIKEQHGHIDELNTKYPNFRIFKSIESDILSDGSLDYTDDILASFDMVIASVHNNLKMTEEKAMERLLKAIANPYTTILGHMTGRLLLSRKGYPVDHKTIIDACAAHNVVIELNAHPRRLDIDWHWIPYAIEKNVLISIDPDAHSLEGFSDIKYGVLAAQKGNLQKEQNLSSYSLDAFQQFLSTRKKAKGI